MYRSQFRLAVLKAYSYIRNMRRLAQIFGIGIAKVYLLYRNHSHPSPLSRRPFVGCGHFGGANAFLCERASGLPARWW